MEKLKNYLFYCGLDRADYMKIRDSIRENRRSSIAFFAPATSLIFGILLLQRVMSPGMGLKVYAYLAICVMGLLMTVGARTLAKKYTVLSTVMVVVYINCFLMMGVYAGVTQPTERTTLLLPFYILTATLFTTAPAYLSIVYLETEIIYLGLIFKTQTGVVLYANTMNSIIFCVAAMIVSVYSQLYKYKRYLAEYEVNYLVERDAMTSLYNRFKYENELERIKREKLPVTVCAFDVNGLKRANDSMGHGAGDELIISAGECIESTFGRYGEVFRTGGDEFTAILFKDPGSREDLLAEFHDLCEKKKGRYIDGVHVSCGMASVEGDPETDLSEAIKRADALMYEDKENYYRSHEIDRRRR